MPLETHREPLAIVGVDCLFPGSTDVRGFWCDLLAGNDQMRDVPPSHWLIEDYYDPDPRAEDRTYAKRGAFLDPVDLDPLAWGLPPKTLEATDTSQLLALIVAQRVLADATRGQFRELDRSRVSVILGVAGATELLGTMVARMQRPVWVKAMREAGLAESQVQEAARRILDHCVPWQESTFPGLLGNVVAGRIANKLDLGGTNCVTDAACASSVSALSMAANELYLGDSDLVITGGVDAMNDAVTYLCFSKTPALSPTGDCRPFSDAADGTMLGEGIGMVAIKRLSDAERDGDLVYATVRGIGASSDGAGAAVYAPIAAGQARSLRRAYDHAGYGPDTVELVEAHGTGTQAGDAAEFEGLRTVFNESGRGDRGWCSLGSVKSLIGHTKAAAGAAGLVKAVLALHSRALPPMPKVRAPNPDLSFAESPFSLSVIARPWIRGDDHERRASVSSFGFGGSNFHVTLSESTGAAPRAPRLRAFDAELVLLTGDLEEVRRRAKELASAEPLDGTLRWLSATSAAAWSHDAPARLAIVARDEQDLAGKLRRAEGLLASGQAFGAPGIAFGVGPPAADGTLAFLFPGQGSQELHMGSSLALAFDAAIGAWDEADRGREFAERLSGVVFPPTAFDSRAAEQQEARLRETAWAQPALACASLAQLAVLDTLGIRPAFTGGHSFGELTALHSAGAFDAPTLRSLAHARGQAMHDAATTPGAMLAVACSVASIGRHLEAWGSEVVIANHNGPEQVVLAGPVEDIDDVEKRCREAKLNVSRLPVATAFHSPVVAAAVGAFARALAEHDIGSPRLPVYSNVSATRHGPSVEGIRHGLAAQLTGRVRFAEMIEQMYADGARIFVEVGPGAVLSGLVRQILAGNEHRAIALDRRGPAGLGAFLEGIGALAAAGQQMDLTALWGDYRPPDDPRAGPRPRLTVPISGVNHGRRYPPQGGPNMLPGPDDQRPYAVPASRPPPPVPTATAPAAPATAMHTNGLGLPTPPVPGQPAALPVAQPQVLGAAFATAHGPVPGPAPMPMAAPAVPAAGIEALHEHAARAHASCMETLAHMHEAYLDTYARTVAALNGGVAALPASPAAAPHGGGLEAYGYGPMAPAATGNGVDHAAAAAALAPLPTAQAPASTAAATQVLETIEDLVAVMLEVVADKTGYPVEMLELGMDMQADLGIDSIKRVEILSALRERVPGLPEVDLAAMAELATLEQVVAYMRARAVDAGTSAPAGDAPTTATPDPLGISAPGQRVPAVTELVRSALHAVERGAPGFAVGSLPGLVVVCDDGTPLARLIAQALSNAGVACRLVAEVPADAGGVVLLATAMSRASATDDLVHRLTALRPVAARLASSTGLLVTVQDTGGTFGVATTDAGGGWGGGLTGLARTAALEWPQASIKAIDVERADLSDEEVAGKIVAELLGGGTQMEVGLTADGKRWGLESRDAPLAAGSVGLRPEDVVVVSGGARGITAACTIALAEQSGALFVLLGRTQLDDEPGWLADVKGDAEVKRALLAAATEAGENLTPPELGSRAQRILAAREVRATLSRIQALGASAAYEAVDVTDADAVSTTLGRVRERWGAITALVHGAGVLADKRIEDTSPEDARRVVATKVDGLASLLAATADDDLRLLCVFSSVAARYGNVGQAGYAMANEVLNKIAQAERRRRGPTCLVRALAWGPWDGGMVTPALAGHFRDHGVGVIPIELGTRAFVDELASDPGSEVEVLLGAGGAVELPVASPKPAQVFVMTGTTRHPQLTDHAIDGRVIVPAAFALDWFARAAGELWPERPIHALADFQVLAGLCPNPAELVTIVEQDDQSLLMLGGGGRPAYRCRAAHADDHPTLVAPPRSAGEYEARIPYGESLTPGGLRMFHGPSFHVLESIGAMGGDVARATIRTALNMGWEAEPWLIDPALMDGVMQLFLVGAAATYGAAAMPTGITYIRWNRAAAPSASACSCTLFDHEKTVDRIVADAVVDSADGVRLLDLRGITFHSLPK